MAKKTTRKTKKIEDLVTTQPPFPTEVFVQRYSESACGEDAGDGFWMCDDNRESAGDSTTNGDIGARDSDGLVAVYTLDRVIKFSSTRRITEIVVAVP